MKKILPVLLCILFTLPAWSQTPSTDAVTLPATVDPAKAAEIQKMLQLTGMVNLLAQMKTQMLEAFKTQSPTVSPQVWDKVEAEMDLNQLLQDIIPLYDKYYSLDDLKAMNAFYETPAGQHMLAAMPKVMHESMQIGQAWGRKVSQKVASDLQAQPAGQSAAAPAPAPQ